MSDEPTAAVASSGAHFPGFQRRAWIHGVAYAALIVAPWSWVITHGAEWNVAAFVVLFVSSAIATRFTVDIGVISVAGDMVLMLTCAVIAPALAPLCALPTLAMSHFSTRQSKVLSTLSVAAAIAWASFASERLGEATDLNSLIVLVAITGSTYVFVNVATIVQYMVALRLSTGTAMISAALATVLSTALFLFPTFAVTIWAWSHLGLASIPLVVVPMTLTQYFASLYSRKAMLTVELAEKAQVLARTNLQFAAAMVRALDTRDAYTAGHSAAVAVYTRDIAREMGFDDETVRMAHLAGLLHDIGKIGVPGRVLNKTAPLDDEEYELMKSHAAMGAEILGEVDLYKDIAVLVRYHHERIDGRGYPDKLEGEAIPAISRMISVADTYSAMTTDRPYREGMPTEKAMSILRECRGTQLDSDFTDAFLRILIVADAEYQRGKQTEFEVEVAKHQALSQVEAEAVRIDAPTPAGPKAPAAPEVPMLPAAVDGELVEVELEREAA